MTVHMYLLPNLIKDPIIGLNAHIMIMRQRWQVVGVLRELASDCAKIAKFARKKVVIQWLRH